MPLPQAIRATVRNPLFWSRFFWESDVALFELKPCVIEFPIAGRFILELQSHGDCSSFGLYFRTTDSIVSYEVAWIAPGVGWPHVLRWEELDLIGRCVALKDPDLPHPGLVILLLCRFAPICVGDDVDLIRPLLETAWRSLDLCSGREIAARIDRLDLRLAHILWQHREPFGWYPSQPEVIDGEEFLATLRNPEPPSSFPFVEWAEMLEAAHNACRSAIEPDWLAWDGGTVTQLAGVIAQSGDLDPLPVLADALEEAGCTHPTILRACRGDNPAEACWVVELISGAQQGSLLRRHFGRVNWPPGMRFRLEIRLPIRDPMLEGATEVASRLVQRLNRWLVADSVGVARLDGRFPEIDDREEGIIREVIRITVELRNDLEQGLRMIRQVLRRDVLPAEAELTQTWPERQSYPIQTDREA